MGGVRFVKLRPLVEQLSAARTKIMSFLRRLVPGLPGRDDDSDEEGEGEALLEHEEDYSSDESESSNDQDEAMERMDNGGNAPINEMPHFPPPGTGWGFAIRGEQIPHPRGPKFWLTSHCFVYYLDIII